MKHDPLDGGLAVQFGRRMRDAPARRAARSAAGGRAHDAHGIRERAAGAPAWRLASSHGVALLAVFLFGCGVAQAQAGAGHPSVFATIWKWTPLLARGFVFNLAISFLAMAIGTLVGFFLGFAQISLLPPVKRGAWLTTHFFRNAPWLVLLFYCMFLLPFQVTVFGVTIPIPDWTKATLGLALPVMANVSEIVRGAIQSIPTTQWESAASLAFNRRQTLWMIIVPQCIKRMLPPWMNLYAILTMAHGARVDRRRERNDDADAARALRGEPARAAAGVLQLRAALVLRLLLSDRALDGSARSALRRRPIGCHAATRTPSRSSC